MVPLHVSISNFSKPINNSVSQLNIKIGKDLDYYKDFKRLECAWFDDGGYCDCLYNNGYIDKNCTFACNKDINSNFDYSDDIKLSFYENIFNLSIKRLFEVYKRLKINDIHRALRLNLAKKSSLSGKLSTLLQIGAIRKNGDFFELLDESKFELKKHAFKNYYFNFDKSTINEVRSRVEIFNKL